MKSAPRNGGVFVGGGRLKALGFAFDKCRTKVRSSVLERIRERRRKPSSHSGRPVPQARPSVLIQKEPNKGSFVGFGTHSRAAPQALFTFGQTRFTDGAHPKSAEQRFVRRFWDAIESGAIQKAPNKASFVGFGTHPAASRSKSPMTNTSPSSVTSRAAGGKGGKWGGIDRRRRRRRRALARRTTALSRRQDDARHKGEQQ